MNASQGCAHDCLYCYAKADAVRFGRRRPDNWTDEIVNESVIKKGYRKRSGRIMLPTTHDITPETLYTVTELANLLLDAGNELLIVSKPRLLLIKSLTEHLRHQDQNLVTFRFTIGSYRDSILRFWEPGAPCFSDRLAALAWCHMNGWKTSVSCEPMLDSRERMIELVDMLDPVVTDSIWIGKMNNLRRRLTLNGVEWNEELAARVDEIERNQADGQIRLLHKELKNHPLVRWKDSIKKVIGLKEEEPG